MTRLHIATRGPLDWQSRLADPEKHWVRGRSAFEAAVSWERARRSDSGLPKEIEALVVQRPELRAPRLLIGLVEHKVDLPHGNRPSQNDVWALVRTNSGLLSMAVEAKAGEDFDVTVGEWLAKQEVGSKKEPRLHYLLNMLELNVDADVSGIRYQLLHRTVSALAEAKRWNADYAAMVVQSFPNPALGRRLPQQHEDFRRFSALLGEPIGPGLFVHVRDVYGIPLFLGWGSSVLATDDDLRSFGNELSPRQVTYPVAAEHIGPADPMSPEYRGTYTPPAPYGAADDEKG